MSSATDAIECNICCDKRYYFTTCLYCQQKACMSCTETFLLDNPQAKCMFCKNNWNTEFLQTNMRSGFMSKAYKNHIKTVIFDRERALFPETQMDIEQDKKNKEIDEIIKKKKQEIQKIKEEIEALEREKKGEKKEKKQVVQYSIPCTQTNCRGFLNQKSVCGICDKQHCSKCRVATDNLDEHKCDANTLETLKMLEKDTKPCPKCFTPIFKIAGCFAENTEILLYNGTIKKSQDIKVGDILVGDDGLPREVLELCSGVDKLYKVSQNNGIDYTVNSKHSLVLKSNHHKRISIVENGVKVYYIEHNKIKSKLFKNQEEATTFLNTINNDNTIHITIDEYLENAKTKSYTGQFFGFKSNGVQWNKKEVLIDPYLLGLWLGDGCSNGMSIASNDEEVVSFLLDWCDNNKCELVHSDAYCFSIRRQGVGERKAIGYNSSTKDCKGCQKKLCSLCDTIRTKPTTELSRLDKNPFKQSLKSYNLLQNKHIPTDYLCNDETTRLNILAGLIDSDGYVDESGKRAVISNTNKTLVNQIEILARSCDFVVNTRVCERKNVSIFGNDPKDYKDIYQINLSGCLSKIPTLIKRKKMNDSSPNKDYHVTSIKVSYKETGKYYGWKVNENTRFVLPDLTVVKNCDQMWCTQCKTPFSWKTGMIETGNIHNPHYWQYLQKEGRDLDQVREMNGLRRANNCENVVQNMSYDFLNELKYLEICRLLLHIQGVDVRKYITENYIEENRELRKEFLTGKIDETKFKKTLQMRQKKTEFKDEVRQLLVMFHDVARDTLKKLHTKFLETKKKWNEQSEKEKKQVDEELLNLTTYVEDQLNKICDRYDYVVPYTVLGSILRMKANVKMSK